MKILMLGLKPKIHLLLVPVENAIQQEVAPEDGPLALDVFKELQFRRVVMEA